MLLEPTPPSSGGRRHRPRCDAAVAPEERFSTGRYPHGLHPFPSVWRWTTRSASPATAPILVVWYITNRQEEKRRPLQGLN